MASFDGNIVTIALPKISSDFSSGFSYLAWVVTGYLLALVALVIIFGKMADVFGRKKLFILGFALFAATSTLCGLSQNVVELVVFRILQGSAAALFFAVSRPILLDNFPANEISFAFGVNTATASVGAVIGPVIGGLLVGVDWRLIFYVNVPIAAIASAVAMREIPRGLSEPASRNSLSRSINPLSSFLFVVTVSLTLTWLTFFSPVVGIICGVSLLLLVVSERRSKNPLVSRDLTGNRGFVYSLAAIVLLSIGYRGIPFAMSFYFQSIVDLTPALTGVLIAPMSLTIAVGSVAAGRIYGRMKSPNVLSIVGAVMTGVGLLLLAVILWLEASIWVVTIVLSVVGLAVGLYWIPLLTTTLRFPRQEIIGATSGTFSTFANLASAISIAITVGIAAAFLPDSLASQAYSGGLIDLTLGQALLFKEGIAYALIVLGAFNLVSVPLILVVMKEQSNVLSSAARASK
jgi:MFS family permease